jgi:hypothetical protein
MASVRRRAWCRFLALLNVLTIAEPSTLADLLAKLLAVLEAGC